MVPLKWNFRHIHVFRVRECGLCYNWSPVTMQWRALVITTHNIYCGRVDAFRKYSYQLVIAFYICVCFICNKLLLGLCMPLTYFWHQIHHDQVTFTNYHFEKNSKKKFCIFKYIMLEFYWFTKYYWFKIKQKKIII